MTEALWRPPQKRVNNSQMTRFQKTIEADFGQTFSDYESFHKWSVENSEDFWKALIGFYQVHCVGKLDPACTDHGFSHYGWFPALKLNFAENLLAKGKPNDTALHFLHESGRQERTSYDELREITRKLSNGLKTIMNESDVLAAYMPNCSETVMSMLATSSFGGIFTSTSSDFGIEGVVDRFSQSKPRVLICVNGYTYNGKEIDLLARIDEITQKLESVEKVLVVDFLKKEIKTKDLVDKFQSDKFILWDEFLEMGEEGELSFTRLPFNHPQYIMYSSGTTGKPKCIVHSQGGTLLQHIKELGLHTDLNEKKSILYFTTCGWMMWNWLVSSLYFGARVCLYEGSPGKPSLGDFFEITKIEKINIFGTSPKFLKALEDSGYRNIEPLPELETILSTGAPLLPEQYEYVYHHLKADLCLSSIAGGTDIIGCFMLGNPNLPVYRGEIQCRGLGMDVAAFNEKGEPQQEKEGELVCQKSFPSRPLCFLNDEKDEKLRKAYFDVYPNIWHHGDFVEITKHGGVKVYGRSDATLNPGGVRIGTAEIYRQTEGLPWIEDSLCVGKTVDGDVEVVLFIKLKEGKTLTDHHIKEVKTLIKEKTTPRHVPKHIISVSGIPYTRSGKKMELAVTRILAGRPLTNIEAVANPECLKDYERAF